MAPTNKQYMQRFNALRVNGPREGHVAGGPLSAAPTKPPQASPYISKEDIRAHEVSLGLGD